MAQIAITLAPTLVTSLSLTGAGSTVTVSEPTAGVMTILSEVLRGEQGIQGPAGDQGIQGIQGIQGPQGDQGPPAPDVHAAAAKATPNDADEFGIMDSAASWVLKKVTWANIKTALKTYFDTLYITVSANIAYLNGTAPFTANQTFNGNLGVGTASPLAPLQVSIATTETINKIGAILERTGGPNSGAARGIGLAFKDSANATLVAGVAGIRDNAGADYNGSLRFFVNVGGVSATTFANMSERMRVTAAGDVGIGTTTPGAKLDVVGTARVGGAVGFNGALLVKGGLGFDGDTVIRQAANGDGYSLQFWGTKIVLSDTNSGSYTYTGAAFLSAFTNGDGKLFMDFGTLYATPTKFQVGKAVGNDTVISLNDGTGFGGAGVQALWGSSASGKIGIYISRYNISARLHIGAGTAAAATAPLKLTPGVNLTTPESGAFEFDGTNLYFTVGGVRKTVTLV